MNKRRLLRLALIAAAALACLAIALLGRFRPVEHTQGITLWYTAEDCPDTVMESLLDVYRQETGSWVEGVCFENEGELGAAFETGRPDLLFCSHIRAAQLDEREPLGTLASPLPIPTKLADVRPAVGVSFCPVGSRLPLLLADTAHAEGDFPDFETLLDTAEGAPFLASDCWAELLYSECLAAGGGMTGLAAKDAEDPVYAALYNRVAGAAFRGEVIAAENAADYVRLGELPCAVTRSTKLAGLDRNDLTFRAFPLPLPKDGQARYPAELMGFAPLAGADMQAAERFLQWLGHGRAPEMALAAGLVPAADAYTGRGADSDFARVLVGLAAGETLFWPDADEPFFQNRAACEAALRETLDLLA